MISDAKLVYNKEVVLGVERGLIGEIVTRFEKRGLKIIGMKMVRVNKNLAMKHYTDDITKRRGARVRRVLMDFVIDNTTMEADFYSQLSKSYEGLKQNKEALKYKQKAEELRKEIK